MEEDLNHEHVNHVNSKPFWSLVTEEKTAPAQPLTLVTSAEPIKVRM